MFSPAQFETSRLILRPPQMEDAALVLSRWAQDPEVTRTMTWLPHKDVEDTRFVLRRMMEAWAQATRFPYAIVERASSQPIGMIEMRPEGEHQAELGYVLARDFWGKGYMTESARALIGWLFQQPNFYRLYATTSVDNLRSQRVMERIGMTREGLLRRHVIHPAVSAEPLDSYLYALVR